MLDRRAESLIMWLKRSIEHIVILSVTVQPARMLSDEQTVPFHHRSLTQCPHITFGLISMQLLHMDE